jgi:lipopolysaccharide transport system ATP-binding protein
MPSIRLESVRKAFPLEKVAGRPEAEREKIALDEVTLSIPTGTRLGIVGPNGAGKSTLLHLIAGLTKPTAGTVSVNGQVTSILTLGLGLREDLSGRDNIYLDGEVQGRSKAEVDAVISEMIEFSELGEFIDYPVRTYSTGMKSRLMFSMISHLSPEILLVDEALSAGDYKFSQKATRRIHEICDRGQIVVVVSHSLTAINGICDRTIWLQAGRVVMDGATREVTAAYEKAVLDTQDAELREGFRAHAGSESLRSGYAIRSLEMRYAGELRKRDVFETGSTVAADMECDSPRCSPGADLRLVLERLDGLTLMDESLSAVLHGRTTQGSERIRVTLDPLMIGWGTYRFVAELLVAGVPTARSTLMFEVITPNPARGGRPALVYPVRVTAAST